MTNNITTRQVKINSREIQPFSSKFEFLVTLLLFLFRSENQRMHIFSLNEKTFQREKIIRKQCLNIQISCTTYTAHIVISHI